MSYIPKYIMKRMFTQDCVKKVAGGLEISMLNVISPLGIDDIPLDAQNHIKVSVDGKELSADQKSQIKFLVQDKTFTVAKAKEFEGVIIPVGGTIKVFLPIDLEKGTEHDFEVIIMTNNPFQIQFRHSIS